MESAAFTGSVALSPRIGTDGSMESAAFTGSVALSPDRYRGYHGLQAVVRDVGPGGGWPTLTKTNYVEWAAVMRVKL